MKVYRGTLEKVIVFPDSIAITTDNIDTINLDKVIYCEISPRGAMGNEGGILMYLLKDDNTLVTYETNIEVDEEVFNRVSDLIGKHADLFVNYYGGMGNYIYVKKGAELEIDEKYKCFWFHTEKTKLRIDSSVEGVFLSVAGEMTGESSE